MSFLAFGYKKEKDMKILSVEDRPGLYLALETNEKYFENCKSEYLSGSLYEL